MAKKKLLFHVNIHVYCPKYFFFDQTKPATLSPLAGMIPSALMQIIDAVGVGDW
jgi:hypothetical protein